MERLVAQGINVNKKNKEGYTALHFGKHKHIAGMTVFFKSAFPAEYR